MSDRLKEILVFALGLLLLVILSVALGGLIGYEKGTKECVDIKPDTIRITNTKMHFITSPPTTVTNTEIKYVPVPQYIHETDTITDTITVPLPFEQHFAKLDDVADVWFSGYQAKIDSAITYHYHTTEIINNYVKEPSPKNLVNVTAGAIDASVGYMHRIGPIWVGISAGYTYNGTPTVRGSLGYQF